MINQTILEVTKKIIARSSSTRRSYLKDLEHNFNKGINKSGLSCGNLAHAFAGCDAHDKEVLSKSEQPNLGIITAYNDMLSAHKTYETYPPKLRAYANEFNATAQVAGATPAMCDGVTQGQLGMDLSLMSRDVIALSSAIGLSHNMFDGVLNLGICDKIVPGLLIGNLSFGHLPSIFIPGGPMHSGISNEEKARIRMEFAEGKISREELLKGESDSYHSPGTCTFYGTANSNQMLLEIMGMQLPGSSFVNPDTEMREQLNRTAVRVLIKNIESNDINYSIGKILDEKAIVNGIIGLLATGGSTNHTLHLIAIAKAAGIIIEWNDFSLLSEVIPLITRVYPNGAADVNHFHASGGMGYVIHTLLENGLLHKDVNTILGHGLDKFSQEPKIKNGAIEYAEGPKKSLNDSILRPVENPFDKTGGLKVLSGNLGTGVIKISAVDPEHYTIEADAIVFDSQQDFIDAFNRGELERDFIAVIAFQGPAQRGMPELHRLTPQLTILQKKGYKVGLVTDGRMSGASGKVPALIHLSPEAARGGLIGRIQTGDRLLIDVNKGLIVCKTEEAIDRPKREVINNELTHGRNLFEKLRTLIESSEKGGGFI